MEIRNIEPWPLTTGPGPLIMYGSAVVAPTTAPWTTWPVGTIYVRISATASSVGAWQKKGNAGTTADWIKVFPTQAHIDIPLFNWREVTSNNIPNIAALGGILANDTTPILEYTNGDTDSAIRLRWAAGNVDKITTQLALPADADEKNSISLTVRAAMAGATNAPVLTLDSFFNEGDTKVVDTSSAITGATVAEYFITIASADIPATARTMSIELTPGAHGTDALYVYGTWLSYSRF